MFDDVKPSRIIETIRRHVEGLTRDLARAESLTLSGRKAQCESGAIYAGWPAAHDRDSERELRHALGREQPPEEARRLRFLLEAVTLAWIDAGLTETHDAISTAEAAARIALPDGGSASFRAAWGLRGNERDRAKRAALEEALVRATAEGNARREELHVRLHDRAQAVEEQGYLALVERLSGIGLGALGEELARFEKESGDAYKEHLTWSLRHELDLPLRRAARHDLAWLFSGHRHDAHFPATKLLPSIAGFLERLGIDPRAGGRVRLDVEPRPNKSPRAFCAPVSVPDEIYLSLAPTGGIDDYRSLLHELGHALHFAYARPELPMEFRYLGDNSTTEALAMTFDHLLLSGVFLTRVIGHPAPRELLREGWLRELHQVRRYGAKLRYELALHRSKDPAGAPETYAELLSIATGVRYPPEGYLYDLDRHFSSARYLRAWMLEAQIADYLIAHHGEDWFLNPAAGKFLKDLWATGQRHTAEEVAQLLGSGGLDPGCLRKRILGNLP
ncbi:MAG: hypothetical protein HZA54_05415 [Planctomycetes bacterium]|nr:hypothetical protein [Planctomycetota bacterium]